MFETDYFSNVFSPDLNDSLSLNERLPADIETYENDSIKDCILSSEITDAEVTTAIKSLNPTKSSSRSLLPDHFILGMDTKTI